MKKYLIIITSIFFLKAFACTSFGFITESGTVIGKNRDWRYQGSQTLTIIKPNKQFVSWEDNNYQHKFKTFALLSDNDIKMGINEVGLTAIEEDPLTPMLNKIERKYIQPINGYAEGMVLWGILQNFATVDEAIPYIKNIFKNAAPNFYQIADGQKILTVEVAFAKSNQDKYRNFTYKILDKKDQIFTSSNIYLSPKFNKLNFLRSDKEAYFGAKNRKDKMQYWLDHSNRFDNRQVISWFLDTKSTLGSKDKVNWCQHTSIFRSYIPNTKELVTQETNNPKIYGTVSSLIVFNNVNPQNIIVNFKIINSIKTFSNGDQQINYNELNSNLDSLFKNTNLNLINKTLMRKSPRNFICE